MIKVLYTLRGEDSDLRDDEVEQSAHVPRASMSATPTRSSTCCGISAAATPYVSVTACELSWHKNIAKITADWDNAHR